MDTFSLILGQRLGVSPCCRFLPHCLIVFLSHLSPAFVISAKDRCEICMFIPIVPRLFRFWKTLNAQRCL